MSEPTYPLTVHQAVSAAMDDIRAVGKDSKNTAPGQGNYSFRGIDAVMNAAGPAFRKHRVVVVPRKVNSIEYTTVTVGAKQSVMASVRVMVTYRWFGPDGDHFDTQVPGEAFDSGDKATAKAMSVAYRTLLIQALTLPTGERDPDADSYERSGHDDSAEKARDIGRWRGEVNAAGGDRGKLGALWARMKAEWESVAWSDERLAIIQPAVDAMQAGAKQPAPPAEPDAQPDGDQAGTDFLVDLGRAEKERDLLTIRQLIAKAQTMKRPDLRRQANDSLNGVKELLAAEAEG